MPKKKRLFLLSVTSFSTEVLVYQPAKIPERIILRLSFQGLCGQVMYFSRERSDGHAQIITNKLKPFVSYEVMIRNVSGAL